MVNYTKIHIMTTISLQNITRMKILWKSSSQNLLSSITYEMNAEDHLNQSACPPHLLTLLFD